MTPEIVDYFTSRGVRVMLSIGGITYTDDWNAGARGGREPARAEGGRGRAAARRRHRDRLRGEPRARTSPGCSRSSTPTARCIPYDATGANPTARLTIDLAAGDRWLIGIDRKATGRLAAHRHPGARLRERHGARRSSPPPRRRSRTGRSTSTASRSTRRRSRRWRRRSSPGASTSPRDRSVRPECNDFAASLQSSTGAFVQTVAPKAGGTTAGCSAACSGRPRGRRPAVSDTQPPEHLRGRRRRRRDDLRHPDADAAAAPALTPARPRRRPAYGVNVNDWTTTSTGLPSVGAAPPNSHRLRRTRSSPGFGTSLPV